MTAKFKYKEKEYYVENTTHFKNPQTREWIKAYNYISVETGERYTRECEEFDRLFEAVENDLIRV